MDTLPIFQRFYFGF